MSINKRDLVISGLQVHVHSHSSSVGSKKPFAAYFYLHGRGGSTQKEEGTVESLVRKAYDSQETLERDLLIVTFDHRNHGTRIVDEKANHGWREDPPDFNGNHAIDMYGIQTGSAQDVQLLIDFLPCYLFPSGERSITDWGIAGKSLGGHSTWIALSQDSRLRVGIPIIGCPDYYALMGDRAKKYGVPVEPPYFPESLLALLKRHDPVSLPYFSSESSNPFLGKKILVLSGADDTMVPWSMSKDFVQKLEVGKHGEKKVMLMPDTGHQYTEDMIAESAKFIQRESLWNS